MLFRHDVSEQCISMFNGSNSTLVADANSGFAEKRAYTRSDQKIRGKVLPFLHPLNHFPEFTLLWRSRYFPFNK